MASPQQKPDPSRRPPDDPGLTRVDREVGKGRPFARWWIVVLVIVAAIVWWMGWGRGRTTTPPAGNHSAVTAPGAVPPDDAGFATGNGALTPGRSPTQTRVSTAMRASTRQI